MATGRADGHHGEVHIKYGTTQEGLGFAGVQF